MKQTLISQKLYGSRSLTVGLGVGVVATLHLPVAGETGLGHLRQDRVVLPRDTGDGLLQHGQVHVTFLVTILGLLVTILGLLVTVLGLLVTVLGLLLVGVAVGRLLVLRRVGVAKVGVVALRSKFNVSFSIFKSYAGA